MCFEPGRKALFCAVVAALVLTLSGCGKKGDPLPPLRDVPLRSNDLTIFQQGRLLVLETSYPAVTISGMPLGGIDALELLELVKPVSGSAVEAADEAEDETTAEDEAEDEAADEAEDETTAEDEAEDETAAEDDKFEIPTIQAAELEAGGEVRLALRGIELEAALIGDRIQIRLPLADEPPAEPAIHYFGVRTLKGDEVSALSNLVGVIPIEPPPAPANLTAEARQRSIELTWEHEAPVEAFDVFRRQAEDRGYGKPVKRLESDELSWRDSNVEYGQRYIYTVRAVAKLDPLIWSDEAGEREVDYQDRFAPPLPRNFVALGERSRVRLRWEASQADDVAGYVLYRREPRVKEFRRLNDDLITGAEYLDRGLVSGFRYEYKIQAVDQNGNESELSKPPAAASVR